MTINKAAQSIAGPSSVPSPPSPPPPPFDEHNHLLIDFDDEHDDPPPEFAPYHAEYFDTGNGNIVSHDPHLNTDGRRILLCAVMVLLNPLLQEKHSIDSYFPKQAHLRHSLFTVAVPIQKHGGARRQVPVGGQRATPKLSSTSTFTSLLISLYFRNPVTGPLQTLTLPIAVACSRKWIHLVKERQRGRKEELSVLGSRTEMHAAFPHGFQVFRPRTLIQPWKIPLF